MHPKNALSQAHDELIKTLEGFTNDDAENGFVTEKWTIKDIVGNLSVHENVLENIITSQIVPRSGAIYLYQLISMGEEEFNKYQYDILKTHPYSDILAELNTTNHHIQSMFSQFTDDMLDQKGKINWFNKDASIGDYILQVHCPRKRKYTEQIAKYKKHLEKLKHEPSKK
ncbi:MAG TPA: hypothetical protein VEC17_00225 [Candidatus Binatia bacterium]|nr:hypothetical protein [Candidatus Binatia bacterium]